MPVLCSRFNIIFHYNSLLFLSKSNSFKKKISNPFLCTSCAIYYKKPKRIQCSLINVSICVVPILKPFYSTFICPIRFVHHLPIFRAHTTSNMHTYSPTDIILYKISMQYLTSHSFSSYPPAICLPLLPQNEDVFIFIAHSNKNVYIILSDKQFADIMNGVLDSFHSYRAKSNLEPYIIE